MPTIFFTDFSGGQSKYNKRGIKFPTLSDVYRNNEFWRNNQCWVFNDEQLNKITPSFTLSQLNISASILNSRPYCIAPQTSLNSLYPHSWAIQLLNNRIIFLTSNFTVTDYLDNKGKGAIIAGPPEIIGNTSRRALYYNSGGSVIRRMYVNDANQLVDEIVVNISGTANGASFMALGPNNGLYFADTTAISLRYPSTATNRANVIRTNREIKGLVYWNGYLVYATNGGEFYFWNGFDDYTTLKPIKISEDYILSLFVFQDNLYVFACTNYVYSLYIFNGRTFDKIFETKEDWKLARWKEIHIPQSWDLVSNTNFYQIAVLPHYFLFSTENAIWAFGRPYEGADYGLFRVFELEEDIEHPSCLQVLPNTNNIVLVGTNQRLYLVDFRTMPSFFWLVSNPIDFGRPTEIKRMKLYFSYIPKNSIYKVNVYLKKPGEVVLQNEPPFWSFQTNQLDGKNDVLISKNYLVKNDVFLYIEFERISGSEIIGFKGLGIEYQAIDTL